MRAIQNIKALCEKRLKNNYHLKVIDVYQDPKQAVDQQVIAAPTLLKVSPSPARRLIGDMTDEARVLSGLDLPPNAE
jgi:circadian clock protein KaiB